MTMPDRADDEHPRVDEQERRHNQQHLDVEVQNTGNEQELECGHGDHRRYGDCGAHPHQPAERQPAT